jgi:hypothetical protein
MEVPGGDLKKPERAAMVYGTTHVQGGCDQGALKAQVWGQYTN